MGLLVSAASWLAYILGSVAVGLVYYAIFKALPVIPDGRKIFGHPAVATIPYILLTPFFEELIVRAYLMTEVSELTGSTALAVAASVIVQFSYHLYYGWMGAIMVSFLFLAFALYYARSRRALPVIIAHGAFDIYGLIRLW